MAKDLSDMYRLFERAIVKANTRTLEQGKLGKRVPSSSTVIYVKGRPGYVHVTRRDQTTIEARVKGIISYEAGYPVEFREEDGTYVIYGRSVHPSLPVASDPSASINVDFAFLASLGLVNYADKPPTSPSAFSDEFDDGVVDASWTQYGDAGVISATVSEDADGKLRMAMAALAGVEVNTLVKTPPAGDFTFTLKIASITSHRVNFNRPAFLAVQESDHANDILMFGPSPWSPGLIAERFGNFGSATGATNYVTVSDNIIMPMYIQFEKASTTWIGRVSGDGKNWVQQFSTTEPFTIGKVGMGIMPENATYGVNAAYDWARFDWVFGD